MSRRKRYQKQRVISDQAAEIVKLLLSEPLRWWYPYELMQATGAARATLYPLLVRLEAQGVLTSRWERTNSEATGPARHFYRLRGKGSRARRLLAEWESWSG